MECPDVAILLDHFGEGGVERVACHLANGLQRSGFQVEMVVLRDSGPVRSLLNGDVSVHILKTWSGLPRGARLLAAVPDLARYLRDRKPALLHSPGNHTHMAAALAVRLARYDGAFVPKITNPILKHGMKAWHRKVRRRIYAHAFNPAKAVIVLSQSAVARTGMIHPSLPARTTFLHNPYVSDAMIARNPIRAAPATPLILSVGRLSRQKDYPTLLRAAAMLVHRPWRLRICGIGPDRKALLALAERLGIADRVEFSGFVADMAPHYSEATVMALSSRWEDLPATLIEAMACGCPVVSTASSDAVRDLLETMGARAPVPVGDPAALAAALDQALDGRLPAVSGHAMLAYGIQTACDAHATFFAGLMQHASAPDADAPIMSQP